MAVLLYPRRGTSLLSASAKADPRAHPRPDPSRFCCGFVIVWDYINVPCYARDQGMVFSWVFNYAYVGVVLLLFMHFFYVDNFQKKRRKSASEKKAI